MATAPKQRGGWSGSSAVAVNWAALVAIFDALYGPEYRGLPRFPEILGGVSVTWTDADRCEYSLDHLDELREPYEQRSTLFLTFHGRLPESNRYADFEYWPGSPRPRVKVGVEAPPNDVVGMLAPVRKAFPLPPEGALIFISWGGEPSKSVATSLQRILKDRFSAAEVFFSATSIDPGDDPLRRMLEEGLLRAQVLVAVLTEEASTRPWVIWETASAWARQALVIPIFVDIDPNRLPGPLVTKVQGVHIENRIDIDRALRKIAETLRFPYPSRLTDDDHDELLHQPRRL